MPMDIKNILVEVDSGNRAQATVEAAAALAGRFGAKLHGFHIMPDFAAAAAAPAGDMMSSRLVDDLHRDAEARAKDAEQLFRKTAGDLADDNAWNLAGGPGVSAAEAAARVAHYADLVVTGGPETDSDTEPRVVPAQDLVVDAGRPLLFNPEAAKGGTIGERVVVAWSESGEAARAAFDALPFLQRAKSVSIVSVTDQDPDGQPPRDKIAEIIAAHGVDASADVVPPRKNQTTSATLFDYAEETGADLLVAGAYSHSRLREGLFGGVTKRIFETAPLPVLMSH